MLILWQERRVQYVWLVDVMNSSSTTLPVFNSHSTKIATICICATSDIVCLPICMCGMMLMYVDNIPHQQAAHLHLQLAINYG